MDQEKIGKFIRKIRNQEKLSQQKFAEKYGVTYQAVSKWENGKNVPDIVILKQMCQDYDMNLDDFLETKLVDKKNEKRRIIFPLIVILLLILILVLFAYIRNQSHFEFKTLSTTCDNLIYMEVLLIMIINLLSIFLILLIVAEMIIQSIQK